MAATTSGKDTSLMCRCFDVVGSEKSLYYFAWYISVRVLAIVGSALALYYCESVIVVVVFIWTTTTKTTTMSTPTTIDLVDE